MRKYLTLRILQAIPVLIGSTFLVYALVFAMPGDPIRAMFGDKQPPQNVVNQIRAEYHLDQPLLVQYLYFMRGVLSFDLGKTFNGRQISDILSSAFPITFQLALLAFIIEVIIGVSAGIFAGMRPHRFFDQTALFISLVILGVPTFVMCFVFQFFFGVQLRILPTTVGANNDLIHMLMPAVVLAGVSIAYVLRLTRGEVIRTHHADYVRTARAKGLNKNAVISKHILRNSMIPVVTYVGTDLVALMTGAVVTESVFNIHGIGHQLYSSIQRGEAPVVVSIVTILIILYVISNIIIDVVYALLDPRIRVGEGAK